MFLEMERTESEGPTRGGVSGAAGISVELPFPSFSSPPAPGSGGGRSGVFMVKVGSREQRPAYFLGVLESKLVLIKTYLLK